MRTYLIDDDNNEFIVDLTRTHIHSSELVEFRYSMLENHKEFTKTEKVFIRHLAGQYFASHDKIHWCKLARQDMPTRLLNINKVYHIYRGYKPSGLSASAEGELYTQMPGKVVKLVVSVGQQVKKGDTVLVLEAMKMENEIKASSDGVIKSIHVKEGQALEQGVLMMEIE
jgi:biotin carboxyl carrier protein